MAKDKPAFTQSADYSPTACFGYCAKERRIYIRGYIDVDVGFQFATVFDQMRGKDPIVVDITSRGGHIDIGLDIYNRIRSSGCPVITVTFGKVESAALIVFLAGDERIAADHSFISFHWPVEYTEDSKNTPDSYRDSSNYLNKNFREINDIIHERTRISVAAAADYSRHSMTFTSKEAFKMGVVTQVFGDKNQLVGAVRKSAKKGKHSLKGRQ